MGCIVSSNYVNPSSSITKQSLSTSVSLHNQNKGSQRILTSAQGLIKEKAGKISNDYQFLNPPLGKGAFGEVRKAIHKKSGLLRAIKIITKEGTSKEQRATLLTEVETLKQLDHPNILKIYEFYQDSLNFYIVCELCTGGELFDKIIEKQSFSEKNAAYTMKQILSAVHYCHKQGIVHRDLKPENILYESPGDDQTLKIIDFGTSRVFKSNNEKMNQKFGTPYYIAPEVLKYNYTYKCDIWSCGVILHVLLVGQPPFNGPSEKSIMNKVLTQQLKLQGAKWDNISQSAKDLVKSMMNRDVDDRVDSLQALDHPWFKQFEFELKGSKEVEQVVSNMSKCIPQKRLGQATWIFLVNYLLGRDEKLLCEQVFQK